jgi:hypothetical protein
MPFFPDCYDEWGLYKITYDGDHKMYEMLFEGTEKECRLYAYENYTDKEHCEMCLMDWEAREWDV